jgi:hypothetical protein
VLRPDVPDVAVIDDHRQVARHLELVSSTDADAVDAGNGRLAYVAQPVVHLDERPHPAPVLAARGTHQGLLVKVGTCAERPIAGAGDDDDRHRLVPRGLFEGPGQLLERREVERVEHVGAIDRDRCHAGLDVALVADVLEAEGGRVGRGWRAGLRHRPRQER